MCISGLSLQQVSGACPRQSKRMWCRGRSWQLHHGDVGTPSGQRDCMGFGRLWGVGAEVLDLRRLEGHRDVEEDVLKQVVGPLLMQRG